MKRKYFSKAKVYKENIACGLVAVFSAGAFSSCAGAMEKVIDDQLLVNPNGIKDDEKNLNELKKDIKEDELVDLPRTGEYDDDNFNNYVKRIGDVIIFGEVDKDAKGNFLKFIISEEKNPWLEKTNWELIEEIFGPKTLCGIFCDAYREVGGKFVDNKWVGDRSEIQLERDYNKFQSWFQKKFGRKMSKMDLIFALHKTYGETVLLSLKNLPSAFSSYIRKALICVGFNYGTICAKEESHKGGIEEHKFLFQKKLVKDKLFSCKSVVMVVIISLVVVCIVALIILLAKTTGPKANKEKTNTKNQQNENEQDETNENLEPKQSFGVSSTAKKVGKTVAVSVLGASGGLGIAKYMGEKTSNSDKSSEVETKGSNSKEKI